MNKLEIFEENLIKNNIYVNPIGNIIKQDKINGKISYKRINEKDLIEFIPEEIKFMIELPRIYKKHLKIMQEKYHEKFNELPPIRLESDEILTNLPGAYIEKDGGDLFYLIKYNYRDASTVVKDTLGVATRGLCDMKTKKDYYRFFEKNPVQFICWNDYKRYKFNKIEDLIKEKLTTKGVKIKRSSYGTLILLYETYDKDVDLKEVLSNYLYDNATIINYPLT